MHNRNNFIDMINIILNIVTSVITLLGHTNKMINLPTYICRIKATRGL